MIKKRIIIAVLTCGMVLLYLTPAFTFSGANFSSAPNTVESGARAIGMGGAFIAIADDATAASWNPAALMELKEPEASIVGNYVYRKENNSIKTQSNEYAESGSGAADYWNLNYLSFVYPSQYITIALTYQHLYDFMQDYHFNYNSEHPASAVSNRPSYREYVYVDYEREGSLYALGLSFATNLRDYNLGISESIWLGITINYWGDFIFKNQWKTRLYEMVKLNNANSSSADDEKQENFSFKGWNANIGFLWNDKSNKWKIGCVFKTPFTADIGYNNNLIERSDKLKMPMAYGIGISHTVLNGSLILSGDIYRTHWEKFIYSEENGREISPITGKVAADSDIATTTSIRLGLEYLIKKGPKKEDMVIPIRIGAFYDPLPENGSSDNSYGLSFGIGIKYESYILGIAYQFRFGKDIGHSKVARLNDDFSQDVYENTVYISMIKHF